MQTIKFLQAGRIAHKESSTSPVHLHSLNCTSEINDCVQPSSTSPKANTCRIMTRVLRGPFGAVGELQGYYMLLQAVPQNRARNSCPEEPLCFLVYSGGIGNLSHITHQTKKLPPSALIYERIRPGILAMDENLESCLQLPR